MPRIGNEAEQRRASGICVICKTAEVGVNRDGTRSIRCEPCKALMAQRPPSRKAIGKESSEHDVLEVPSYLETGTFNAYCVKTAAVMKKIQGRAKTKVKITTRMVREGMGESYNETLALPALDRLVAAHEITLVRSVCLSYWVYGDVDTHRVVSVPWNQSSKSGPAVPRPDSAVMFGEAYAS